MLFFCSRRRGGSELCPSVTGGRLAHFLGDTAIGQFQWYFGATAWVVDKVYRYEMSRLNRNNVQLSVLCPVITLGIYFANKRLYRRFAIAVDAIMPRRHCWC